MDPEGETLSAEAAVRQNLQQRLLDAVKQARRRAAGDDRDRHLMATHLYIIPPS